MYSKVGANTTLNDVRPLRIVMGHEGRDESIYTVALGSIPCLDPCARGSCNICEQGHRLGVGSPTQPQAGRCGSQDVNIIREMGMHLDVFIRNKRFELTEPRKQFCNVKK